MTMIRSILGLGVLLLVSASAMAQGDSAGGAAGSRPVVPVTGAQVYQTVCQACHMADGRGGRGAATIPALAGNPNLAEPDYPILLVLNGRGAMPYLRDTLDDAQIAGVATYVRTSFGNKWKKPVTAADVARVRKMAGGD
jgi:mono/diheme cytochrome c family protein